MPEEKGKAQRITIHLPVLHHPQQRRLGLLNHIHRRTHDLRHQVRIYMLRMRGGRLDDVFLLYRDIERGKTIVYLVHLHQGERGRFTLLLFAHMVRLSVPVHLCGTATLADTCACRRGLLGAV